MVDAGKTEEAHLGCTKSCHTSTARAWMVGRHLRLWEKRTDQGRPPSALKNLFFLASERIVECDIAEAASMVQGNEVTFLGTTNLEFIEKQIRPCARYHSHSQADLHLRLRGTVTSIYLVRRCQRTPERPSQKHLLTRYLED